MKISAIIKKSLRIENPKIEESKIAEISCKKAVESANNLLILSKMITENIKHHFHL